MTERSSSWRIIARRTLVVGMLAAVALNIAQFRAIDEETRHNYRAIHAYDTPDLFEIGIGHDNSSRRWVAPFHYLGELFPGSTVITPEGGIRSWFPFDESALAFGRADELLRAPYDPEQLVALEELSQYRLPTASFVPDRGSARRIVEERVAYYLDSEPAQQGSSRTFIVVTPDGSPGRTDHLAFIEVTLLDPALQRELGIR